MCFYDGLDARHQTEHGRADGASDRVPGLIAAVMSEKIFAGFQETGVCWHGYILQEFLHHHSDVHCLLGVCLAHVSPRPSSTMEKMGIDYFFYRHIISRNNSFIEGEHFISKSN